jgi:hypothetical protein
MLTRVCHQLDGIKPCMPCWLQASGLYGGAKAFKMDVVQWQ